MGKVIPFKTKAELEHDLEVEAANEMVAEIRKMFTDEEIEQISLELEGEEVEDFQVDETMKES